MNQEVAHCKPGDTITLDSAPDGAPCSGCVADLSKFIVGKTMVVTGKSADGLTGVWSPPFVCPQCGETKENCVILIQ